MAQPLLGALQAVRSVVRGLHGRAPHPDGSRRHHCARGYHLHEPDRLHAAAQAAGGRVPCRRDLAAGGRVQSLLWREDVDPDPRQIVSQEDPHHRLLQG